MSLYRQAASIVHACLIAATCDVRVEVQHSLLTHPGCAPLYSTQTQVSNVENILSFCVSTDEV